MSSIKKRRTAVNSPALENEPL